MKNGANRTTIYSIAKRPRTFSLDLVGKLIDIFAWVVKALVITAIGLIIVSVIIAGIVFAQLLFMETPNEQSVNFGALAPIASLTTQADEIFKGVQVLLAGVWGFLKPILQLMIVIALLRWLLFSQQGQLSSQIRSLLADVPSVIAILVISAICLVTILGADIPPALANVALVIVGFYFGQERQKGRLEAQGKASPDKPESTDSVT